MVINGGNSFITHQVNILKAKCNGYKLTCEKFEATFKSKTDAHEETKRLHQEHSI